MVQGFSNPRPGFGIAVPGNEIPGLFNHQSKGPSISVQVPSLSMGFVACVAFSASGEIRSFFCHFKANEERIILRRCVLILKAISFQIIFGYSIYLLITLKSFKNGSMDPLATSSCCFILPNQE